MSWWLLILIWLVLTLIALAFVALVAWRVFGRFRALLREIGAATDLLEAAAEARPPARGEAAHVPGTTSGGHAPATGRTP